MLHLFKMQSFLIHLCIVHHKILQHLTRHVMSCDRHVMSCDRYLVGVDNVLKAGDAVWGLAYDSHEPTSPSTSK